MKFFVPGPAGRLEAWFERPEGEPRGAAVVAHPHPLHGGTMRNTIVFRVARALRGAGLATLRFHFRGVEGSEGEHDGQGAEKEDMRAGLDWLAAELPGLPLWAAGFSFGARTALALAAEDPRVRVLICVAPPVVVYDLAELRTIEQPTFLLFAGNDDFGTCGDLHRQFPELSPRIEAREIPGVGHLFRGKTPLVEAWVRDYASRVLDDA